MHQKIYSFIFLMKFLELENKKKNSVENNLTENVCIF